MEKAKAMFERIKFEKWAKTQEYPLCKSIEYRDTFSDLPAYVDPQTFDAWAGWYARAYLEIQNVSN